MTELLPRKRISNFELPDRVYRKPSGSYEYKIPGTNKSPVIAKKNATLAEIQRAVDEINAEHDQQSLQYLWDRYQESRDWAGLSPRSQKDLIECSQRPLIAFRGWRCNQITRPVLVQYIERRAEKSVRRADYERLWFQKVFYNAAQLGLLIEDHSAGIKPLKLTKEEKQAKKARRRHVSDRDYNDMLKVASPAVWVAMEISYCTGIRLGDVLSLRWEHVQDMVKIEENKTGHEYLKQITPRLQKALDEARKLDGQPFGGWVVRNRWGNQYTVSGFQANWKRCKAKLPKVQQFTFHEIRHKAITEASEKQQFSMHSNARMLGIYDHELKVSPSHE